MTRIFAFLMALFLVGTASSQDVRVFETLTRSDVSTEQTAQNVSGMLTAAGYDVLSLRDVGTEDGCPGSVQVITAWHPAGVDDVFDLNARTAPYALVERVAIFNDGTGTWVSTIRPASLLRTVFLDDPAVDGVASARRMRMRDALGADLERAYGQERGRGKIGKTMGVMAGGPFDEKIGAIAEAGGLSVMEAADRIEAGFEGPEGDWGMVLAYRLDLPDRDLVVFGVTSDEMEARSFSIVGSGSDKERKDIPCAGTAYAPAYPIEMVVRTEGDAAVVETVDAMFRMKMFFEDAGKWAFMKNMTMPGSLASEMKDRVGQALAAEAQ